MASSRTFARACVAAVVLCYLAVGASAATLYPLPLAVADIVAATTTASNRSLVFSKDSTFELEPATGQWATILNASGTSTAACAPMADEVVIMGGGGQEPTSVCTVYHATAKTFSSCAPMPSARGFLGATAVGTTIYAIGGFAAKGWDIVESYDFTTDTWTTGLAPLPTPRYGLSAVTVGGVVYTFGGVAWHIPASGAVEAYTPTTGHWKHIGDMPTPRSFMAVSVLDDIIYTCGGNDGTVNVNVVEAYNPATNTWKTGTPLPKPLRSHFAAFTPPSLNAIVVVGGTTGKGLYQHDVNTVGKVEPLGL